MRRAAAAVLFALLTAAPAQAASVDLVQARTTAGCAIHTVRAPVTGTLSARLAGSPAGSDWDLAVRRSGRLVGASRAFGGAELVQVPVTAGDDLTVRACGSGTPVPLTVSEVPTGVGATGRRRDDIETPRRPRVVTVRVGSPAAARRLARTGLDTSEVAVRGRVTVVLHGRRDAQELRTAGFTAHARLKPRPTARAAQVALPSGRSAYRTLADYQADLKRLVTEHPGLVRPVVLPGTSVQGRALEGVEIATGVDRTDDGRPTVLEVGLHHAREWSSGELVMEHAFDLAQHAATEPRIARLADGVRTVVLPVMNPDGLVATQSGVGGDPTAGTGAYKRKNCAGGVAGLCGEGVDLNRNYGAFWGGPGADSAPASQTYRGPGPFSEPEARALHAWASARQVVVVNATHNFGGSVLHQPGFSRTTEPGLPAGATLPYAERMAALGRAMADAAGYQAAPAYDLYDATGATEDWNYFTQGAFAYTTEVGGTDFHAPFPEGVAAQWPGMRELQLRAGEAALDPANHATIAGTAPPGLVLRIAKDVTTSTSYVDGGAAQALPEHLESTLTVPASGRFTWAVDPSTRPVVLLAGGTEAWTLSCLDAAGTVLQRRDVVVGIGRTAKEELRCGTAATAARPAIAIRSVRRHGRRLVVRLRVTAGPLRRLRLTLRDASGHRRAGAARTRSHPAVTFRARRALTQGRYVLRVSARTTSGRTVSDAHRLRVRG